MFRGFDWDGMTKRSDWMFNQVSHFGDRTAGVVKERRYERVSELDSVCPSFCPSPVHAV